MGCSGAYQCLILHSTVQKIYEKQYYDLGGNLLAETDASNNVIRYYIHGIGLLSMVEAGGQSYQYHFDGTGNTIAMTDGTQSRVQAYAYTPYGLILNEEGSLDQPFTYVGQYGIMREANDVYYMRARYYDAQVGRFISEDPIGFWWWAN